MNVKKAIKRIAAIGTGATLMGATVLGAMAADLADYPAPFVEDGQFNAMLVIGESADAPDVIGAVDIATSLQYEMRTPAAASGEASEGETVSVSGDNVRVDLPYNRLTLGEAPGSVLDTLTDEDLDALRDGELDSTDYTQSVKLDNNGNVLFRDEGGDSHYDEPGWYLMYNSGDTIYDYVLEFPSGLDYSTDLEDEEFEMFGMDYTIDSVGLNGTDDWSTMELLGGAITDTLLEDESGTYTLDGQEYEVEVVYGYEEDARFVVNGESTDTLAEGETYELADGVEIGVKRVLPQSGDRPSYVEFLLGADRIVLEDGQNMERGDDTYYNVDVTFDADGEVLNEVKLSVSGDEDDYSVAPGESLADWFGETDDAMFGNFDLHYLGNTEPMMSEAEIQETTEDEQYEMSVTTRAGSYDIPLAYNDGDGTERIGDSDGTFYPDPTAAPATGIERKDKFVLNTDTSSPEDTTSRIFTMGRIDWRSGDNWYEVNLRDDDGSSRTVTLRADEGNGYAGSFREGGQTHELSVNGTGVNAVNVSDANHANIVALDAGTYLEFGDQTGTEYNVTHVVPEDLLDGSQEEWNFTVDLDDDGEPSVSVGKPTAEGSVGSVDVDDDAFRYSEYGMEVVNRDTSRTRIDMKIPHAQVLPQVYATSGDVSVSETQEEATGDTYDVAPLSAGIAQLDTEVSNWENENIIVVGGPCVNTVAAELLGNPEECTEGFEQGAGRIKLFEQNGNVAMLVAGYAADETRHAASVVNNFRDYDFEGTELEVSGTRMSNLDVSSVE